MRKAEEEGEGEKMDGQKCEGVGNFDGGGNRYTKRSVDERKNNETRVTMKEFQYRAAKTYGIEV